MGGPFTFFQRSSQHADRMALGREQVEVQMRRVAVQEQMLRVQELRAKNQAEAGRARAAIEQRRLRLEERDAELRKALFERDGKQWEIERIDRAREAYDLFSQSVVLEHWPIKVQPQELCEPLMNGTRVPVTFLFRAPRQFSEDMRAKLEDRIRSVLLQHYPRHDPERPVRFYGSDSWNVNAPGRGNAAEVLARYSGHSPTVTLELTQIADELAMDVATWGFDELSIGPPAVGELPRVSLRALSDQYAGDMDAVVTALVPLIAFASVALIDACHLRRNLIAPKGPEILPALFLPGPERLSLIESVRAEYNKIADGSPEVAGQLRLMLGFALAKSEDQTAAKLQAYELCQAWRPELLGDVQETGGPMTGDEQLHLLEMLGELFAELGLAAEAQQIADVAAESRAKMPAPLNDRWFVQI